MSSTSAAERRPPRCSQSNEAPRHGLIPRGARSTSLGRTRQYERYRTIAIHHTTDPNTIVVEHEVEGTSSTTGPFVLPLLVLTARHGEIVHLRDYANVLAAAEAIGRDDT